jgi:hypothetical protein
MTTKSIYKSTGKDSEKPKVNIELLKSPGSENTWKIDIPVNEKYLNPQNALPGTRNIINLFNVTSPLVKFFFQNNLLFIYWNLENINQKFFNILLSECLAIDLFDLNYSGGTEKKRKLIAY